MLDGAVDEAVQPIKLDFSRDDLALDPTVELPPRNAVAVKRSSAPLLQDPYACLDLSPGEQLSSCRCRPCGPRGVGASTIRSSHSKLWQNLERLHRFHVTTFAGTDNLTVRLSLPALTDRQLARLPDARRSQGVQRAMVVR